MWWYVSTEGKVRKVIPWGTVNTTKHWFLVEAETKEEALSLLPILLEDNF